MQYMQAHQTKFGKLRTIFWPIYSHELTKILPMFTLFFLISFVYHLLRCMKVAIVVKAPGSGAEIIPFLKVWLVLPAACIFSYCYARLAQRYDRSTVFNICVSIFIGFFVLFLAVLYPYKNYLACHWFDNILPPGLHGLNLMFTYWPLALFYVFAEMWSIMVLSVLFWGFTNEVTQVNEAKRFYAFIALGANCSAIFSGETVRILSLSKPQSWIPYGSSAQDQSVFLFMVTAIFFSLLIMRSFTWLNKQNFIINRAKERGHIQANARPEFNNQQQANHKYPKEDNSGKNYLLTWLDKFTYLIKLPELGYLTIIVLAYNIVANLADILWSYQLDLRFPDSSQLMNTLGKLDIYIGFTTVIFALFGFSNVIRKFGWKAAALTTPLIWSIASIMVFATLYVEAKSVSNASTTLSFNWLFIFTQIPLQDLIINILLLQMCFGKASKYTFFDQSKEIAFIPLTLNQQRQGKAVIDGITSRFGKSGSSIYFQILLIFCSGEIARTIPYAAGLMLVMLIMWLVATVRLGKILDARIHKQKITINSEPATIDGIAISYS